MKIIVDKLVIDLDLMEFEQKQQVLKNLHKHKSFFCGCNGKPRLMAKCAASQKYYISRFPNEGHLHEIDCKLFFNRSISGIQCYEDGVIKELDNGSIRINLGMNHLQSVQPSEIQANSQITNPNNCNARAQAKMSLLGLIHFLWERSGLNSTATYPNSVKKMYEKLRNEASLIHVGRTIFDDMLLTGTVPLKTNEKDFTNYNASALRLNYRNQEIFEECKKKEKSIFLVSEISDKTANDCLRLKHSVAVKDLNEIAIVEELWEKACLRFPLAYKTLKTISNFTKVMVIAKLDPYYKDTDHKIINYHIVDIAIMPIAVGSRSDLNGLWRIPFDSSYEHDVAHKLMNEKRCFIKPLRYDAQREIVFPDFILTDSESKVPMEVWGMTNHDGYLKRKCEKTEYYAKVFPGIWWEWDINEQGNIPEFPGKVRDCLKSS